MSGKVYTDGNARWDGGMDSSRNPESIAPNQYSRACNVVIPDSGGGISVRGGFRNIRICFGSDLLAEEYFKTGIFQGEGWFRVESTNFLVIVKSGYIFRLKQITYDSFSAEIVNRYDRNSELAQKAYVTRVPEGAIVNDGVNCPILLSERGFRRSKGASGDEIGAGLMGVYLQNRYFQVSPDRKNIIASDFLNHMGVKEASTFNIYGFVVPENEDKITSIGKQKILSNTVEVGALVFSTTDSVYSVDVRKSRDLWDSSSTGLGKVNQTIPTVGAVSPYSFESFGTNLYFRTLSGILNLKQSQYQFVETEDFASQSLEVSNWTSKDTPWMLDKCYTKSSKSKLFTTVSPILHDDGNVYWQGIVVLNPSPRYSNQQSSPRRFESVFTGVRPMALTSTKTILGDDDLYVWSLDEDGEHRLYRYEEDLTYDVNHAGDRLEIRGWIETKGFDFEAPNIKKITVGKFYKVRSIKRSSRLEFFSKTEYSGGWKKYSDNAHYVNFERSGGLRGALNRFKINEESRDLVNLPHDSTNQSFISQERIEFTGHFVFDKIIASATLDPAEQQVTKKEVKGESNPDTTQNRKDFYYSISTTKHDI